EDYLFNESKLWPMMKESFQYVQKLAFEIRLPQPYEYSLWQPWVKNYAGELDIGPSGRFRAVEFIWIDQTLKKSMGY
ncbi:MAG: ABC transporter substrate-binding protein, partial [Chloroflexi bacterium]|nr:ABC transporter substrate-binding protein [Chloroflexota bacterium]